MMTRIHKGVLIYSKNNGRSDFGEIWKDEEMEYGMIKIVCVYIYIYIYIYIMRKIRKILRM